MSGIEIKWFLFVCLFVCLFVFDSFVLVSSSREVGV